MGNGASFLVDQFPRAIQQEVYAARGYISAVMETVRNYYNNTCEGSFPCTGSFPGASVIPSPETTSLPIAEMIYGSFPLASQGGGTFVITFGQTDVSRPLTHHFVEGAKFAFVPQVSGNTIANWQCYTDLEDMDTNLYPGYNPPHEGSTCPLLVNLGEVFSGCLNQLNSDTTLNPPDDPNWVAIYDYTP